MARIARVVIEGVPFHVVQRGNRNLPVFLQEGDQAVYLAILKEQARKHHLAIWAYCLMTNHIHLIAVPGDARSLGRGIGETHRRYTLRINSREGWRGYLWQGRFFSCPLDQRHLLAAARYIERNPVRAGLVERPEEWEWSSARHHLGIVSDPVISEDDLLPKWIDDWSGFLSIPVTEKERVRIQTHARTGRPLGDRIFVEGLERRLGRGLTVRKRGPKGPWKKKEQVGQ